MLQDKGDYVFIPDPDPNAPPGSGRYVFTIPYSPHRPVVVESEEISTLVQMYSNEGGKGTIDECADQLGWDRQVVVQVLRALNVTHTSPPFTRERAEQDSEDNLVEDLVRQKVMRVRQAHKRKKWAETEEAAEKWQSFESFARKLHESLGSRPAPVVEKQLPDGHGAWDLITHATDLHYGKAGWVDETGTEMNRQVTRARLIETTLGLIAKAKRLGSGRARYCFVGVGGDWLHIDNHRGGTTKGTPQDHDGSFLRIYVESCALAEEQIELLRPHFEHVFVVGVRGNHDEYSSAQMIHWLQGVYRHAPDVTISDPAKSRVYHKSFKTLVGFTHGDGVPNDRLRKVMANEAKAMWSETDHRLFITGHLHSQSQDEDFGITIEKFSSLAGADYWHKKKAYVGNMKALQGIVVTQEGPIGKLTARASS